MKKEENLENTPPPRREERVEVETYSCRESAWKSCEWKLRFAEVLIDLSC